MNYQRIYDAIIERAKSRGLNKKLLDGYFEKHHIIPRCMNGTNDRDNLVLLTAREHYLCHWLLWKANKENRSLFYGYHKMAYSKTKDQMRNYKISSKQYEKLQLAHVEFWHNKIVTEETRAKMSKAHKGFKHSEETIEKFKARKHSDETKSKIVSSRRTHESWHSEETKRNISNAKIGSIPWNKGLVGVQIAWNKGIPRSEETKQKIRESLKNRK